MTRKTLMTTTAAALIAAPTLLVADIPAPAAAESSPNPADDVRVEENTASYDSMETTTEPVTMKSGMSKDLYDAVLKSDGQTFATVDGDTIGVIENVTVDREGNAELIVDIAEELAIPAEVLVVEVEQGKVSMVNDALMLETTVGELRTAASTEAGRHSDGRIEITF